MRMFFLMAAVAVLPVGKWDAALADTQESDPATVAVFALDGPIQEAPTGDEFPFGSLGGEPLKDLIARMQKARDDKNVPAIVLLPGSSQLGRGQVEEVRRVLDQIKSAGKEVYVHADALGTRDFALCAGASKISVAPTGMVMITGIRAEQPYVRGLLDIIGVKPDFMTCGAFKSAGEMFMRTGPSEEDDQMTNWLLDSLYETTVQLIAEGRQVPPQKVRGWIDNGLYTAEQARQAGIIDVVQFRQDLTADLKSKYGAEVEFDKNYGKKKPDEIDLSSPLGLLQLWAKLLAGPAGPRAGRDAVAVVYVEGPILPGKPEPSPFSFGGAAYSAPISKALDQAARDDSIKAVVLRVNSPGGSATASEIILNATRRVKAEKPLVVSMGDVAGSGGYYVACASDTIFADASTITASIGVVSGKFATTSMWNKIGITWQSYGRGANSGLLSSREVFSSQERERLQGLMTEVYETFQSHVVAIRGDRLKKDIDELAGGRVFTGRQALELGLVDQLGGLEEAIAHVAEQAGLEKYEVRVLPKPKNFIEQLLSNLGGAEEEEDDDSVSLALGTLQPRQSSSLLHAAAPYLEGLDPHRVRAVKAVLQRLALLEQENVILTMPEIQFCD